MSTEIALRSQASMVDKVEYCRLLADSGMLAQQYRKQPANILWAIEYGETLGLTPMAAINGVHVIEGKPSASAALIGALVRRAGHKLRVRGNAVKATAQIIRCDDPDFMYEVTWELHKNEDGNPNAEEAGLLNKSVWKNYAASMLKARAVSQVAKDACEEVLFGLHYTPEELGVEVGEDGEPVITVRQDDPPLTPRDAADAVVRKEQQQRQVVDLAPRDQRNPFDPDFELPASLGSASTRPATDAQLAKLAILVGEKRGVSGSSKEAKAARLGILGALIGREITTGRDLTLREASDLIEQLTLEPPHIVDAEVVPDDPESPLAADLTAALQEAESEPELDAVLASIAGAMDAGELLQAQGMRLRDAADRKRQGWSHRVLAAQSGVAV